MKKVTIGFSGVRGAYAEEAIYKLYHPEAIEVVALSGFEEVKEAVESNLVDYGILPLENSTTGAIHEVYDLLRDSELYLVSEVCLPIRHCLLGLPQAEIAEIKRVYSHEQGLSQCDKWIKKNKLEKIALGNTAISALHVSKHQDRSWAAIASEDAAKMYNLKVLQREIGNQPINATRFGLLSKSAVVNKHADSTSIVLTTAHKAGALYDILRVFAKANVNLFRIESRPIPNRPWEYYIYLDAEGSILDSGIAQVIEAIKARCSFYKFLGSYKRHEER